MTRTDWDDVDRKVISALEPSIRNFAKMEDSPQKIHKFFDAYARLLRGEREWHQIDRYLSGKYYVDKRQLRRRDLREVSTFCRGSQDDWTWSGLFMITCLWGFAENDKAGAVKLFYAMRTENSREIINATAKKTLDGQLEDAFKKIQHLDQIGPSYATKFLYAVGTSKPDLAPSPVVFDSVINGRLLKIVGKEISGEPFKLENSGPAVAAERYVNYCKAIARWTAELNRRVGSSLSSEHLELRLFTEGKSRPKKMRV